MPELRDEDLEEVSDGSCWQLQHTARCCCIGLSIAVHFSKMCILVCFA